MLSRAHSRLGRYSPNDLRLRLVSIPIWGPFSTDLFTAPLVQNECEPTYLFLTPKKTLHPHRCPPSVFQTPLG